MIARNPSAGTWKRLGRARNMGGQTHIAGPEHIGDSLVDGAKEVPQHRLTMSETGYDKVRRSTRVFMRVRVVVAGKNSDNRRFREACETIVINATRGLLYFKQPLDMDPQ